MSCISKAWRKPWIAGGFLFALLLLTVLLAGYLQFAKYAVHGNIEWAAEASDIQLAFDKNDPDNSRFILIGHSAFGERMIREYLAIVARSGKPPAVVRHGLYYAVGNSREILEDRPYLDYYALVSAKLVSVQHRLFVRPLKPVSNDPVSAAPVYMEALFTKGRTGHPDKALVDKLRYLVQNADPGSYIRFSVFLFYYADEQPLLTDILAAIERGVNVQILADLPEREQQSGHTAGQAFLEAFNLRMHEASKKSRSDSWIRKHHATAWPSKNHSKIFLFSSSATLKDWVIIGSENLTDKEYQKYQAGLVLRSPAVYDSFDRYWQEIDKGTFKQAWAAEQSPGLTSYFFPQREGDDLVYQILDGMVVAPDKMQQGKIWLCMARWNYARFPLAMKLVQLAEHGFRIEIIIRSNDDIVDPVISALLQNRPNISLHSVDVGEINIHSKYMLFEGDYKTGSNLETSGPEKILWVGSHNFTGMAMRTNYETLLEVRNQGIFEDYLKNFEELKALVPSASR